MTTSTIKNFNFSPDTLQQDIDAYNSVRKKIFHSKSDLQIEFRILTDLKKQYQNLNHEIISNIFAQSINVVPISIKRIEVKSTYHILYKVSDLKRSYVLKINVLSDYYKDFTFFLEMKMQERMSKLKLPFLNIYAVDISREKYPFDFMIMDFIDGENLESNSNTTIYFKLGKMFRSVHELPAMDAGMIDIETLLKKNKVIGVYQTWKDFFSINLSTHINKVNAIGIISSDQALQIEKIFLDGTNLLNNKELSILHNDPGTRNVMINNNNVYAIIDWEDGIVGDRLWEIAFLDTFLFRSEDQEKFNEFCRGYGIDRKEVYSTFLYWMYYLRISLIKTISRSVAYYNKEGMKIDQMRIQRSLSRLKKMY